MAQRAKTEQPGFNPGNTSSPNRLELVLELEFVQRLLLIAEGEMLEKQAQNLESGEALQKQLGPPMAPLQEN
jgi:hypothetical protein